LRGVKKIPSLRSEQALQSAPRVIASDRRECGNPMQRRHTLRLLQPFGLRNDRRVCHSELSKKAWQSHQAARKLVDILTLPEHIGVEKALY